MKKPSTFYPAEYKRFVVIGRYYNSDRKFRLEYSGNYAGAMQAMSINLWNGRVYGDHRSGKRHILKETVN